MLHTVQLNNLLVTLYKNGQNTGDNPSHLRSNEQIQKFMRTKLSFPSYPIKTKEDFFRFTDHPKGKFKKKTSNFDLPDHAILRTTKATRPSIGFGAKSF